MCTALLQELGREVPLFVITEHKDAFSLLRRENDNLVYLVDPDSMLEHAVERMQSEQPSTQVLVAGERAEVSDHTSRLLIASNDRVEHEESDDLVIRSLLELGSLRERRRAQDNPLEIVCMLFFDKNVEPAERAGASETVLVGRLLADKIGKLIENM